jgi:chemotaxis protein MotB
MPHNKKIIAMNIRITIALVISVLMFSGCVSQKQFDELLAEKVKLEADYADLESKLGAAETKITRLEEQVEELETETSEKGESINKLENDLGSLQEEHDQLQTYYNNLLSNSGKLNRDLAEQQERLLEIQESLKLKKAENEALATNLEEREKKVQDLERILAEKEKAVNELLSSVKQALLNFSGNELTVEVKNGKVYVSLAEKLLFQSGSIKVDPKGQMALTQLAEALKTSPDINILVEGHTDDVPISTKAIKDNWDLSVLRATSIVRILTSAGVKTEQITAAGKGEFSPVTTNSTTDGRQKNRRTDIILSPDLDELFSMLETN